MLGLSERGIITLRGQSKENNCVISRYEIFKSCYSSIPNDYALSSSSLFHWSGQPNICRLQD